MDIAVTFVAVIAIIIAFIASYFILQWLFYWLMMEVLEFKFIPFRWREGNFALVALPGITASIVWLALWITAVIVWWRNWPS
jgi:hypothetical protein